jgi:hypothetical protein
MKEKYNKNNIVSTIEGGIEKQTPMMEQYLY